MTLAKRSAIAVLAMCVGLAVAYDTARGDELSAARSYWGTPTCGTPVVTHAPLPSSEGGEADPNTCAITINNTIDWSTHDACIIMVHEWGHLALGSVAFRATNPTDPAHSADPSSIMNAGSSIFNLTVPQCEKAPSTVPRTVNVKRVKHRHVLSQPMPDPPPGVKHAYLCPGYYTRVRDITDIYHWNGARYVLVREQRGKPYLIFHQTSKCRRVK